MQPDTDPNNRQNQIWGEAQNPALQQQFQSPQQQVIILNPKYRPELNLRLISTGILVLGIAISIALPFIGIDESGSVLFQISAYICCSSFILALLVDAVYLKGKSDWQTSLGMSNTWSLVSLVLSIIFALGLIFILVLNLIGDRSYWLSMVARAGFEPAKLYAEDLESTPFDRSGTSPMFHLCSTSFLTIPLLKHWKIPALTCAFRAF